MEYFYKINVCLHVLALFGFVLGWNITALNCYDELSHLLFQLRCKFEGSSEVGFGFKLAFYIMLGQSGLS